MAARRDHNVRRLHPRLRMVRNGDRVVNALRSDGGITVACAASPRVTEDTAPLADLAGRAAADPRPLGRRPKLGKRLAASDAYLNVFIELVNDPRAGGDQHAAARRITRLIRARLDDA